MIELFEATFSAVNIIPAIFLTFILFYWLLVIFGALDISSFDFDVDMDADADFDADGGTSEVSISWINNVLSFFNIDKIPLMIFLTFWAIPLWAMSVMVNHLLGNESFILSLILLIPMLIGSLIIAKPLTMPFVKLFSKLNEPTEALGDLLGQIGSVVTGATSSRMGQADVNMDGSNHRINIKTKKGNVKRGQQILVINLLEGEKCYIVEGYETID